jgi:hypothetical protein
MYTEDMRTYMNFCIRMRLYCIPTLFVPLHGDGCSTLPKSCCLNGLLQKIMTSISCEGWKEMGGLGLRCTYPQHDIYSN